MEPYTAEEWGEWGCLYGEASTRLFAEHGAEHALELVLGPRIPALCLHHAVFLDTWLAHPEATAAWAARGWQEVPATNAALWARFKEWMDGLSTAQVDEVMRERRRW
jgi:hypothetical protein